MFPVELSLCGQGVSSHLARISDQQVQSGPSSHVVFCARFDLPTHIQVSSMRATLQANMAAGRRVSFTSCTETGVLCIR
jgi:hypothetical protein